MSRDLSPPYSGDVPPFSDGRGVTPLPFAPSLQEILHSTPTPLCRGK